jgi:hypothetical protein
LLLGQQVIQMMRVPTACLSQPILLTRQMMIKGLMVALIDSGMAASQPILLLDTGADTGRIQL